MYIFLLKIITENIKVSNWYFNINIYRKGDKSMKSLNDVIWNDDVDLEKGKMNEMQLGMQQICLKDSCGGLEPECGRPTPYAVVAQCL